MINRDNRIFDDYSDLLEEFSLDDIADRIDSIEERLIAFIEKRELTNKVCISEKNLWLAVLSYFSDIKRLKAFHGIDKTSVTKIHSYMAFWLLRKKPLQIIEDFDECERINERFAAFYLVDFLLRENREAVLSGNAKNQFLEFTQTLYYYFSYRVFSAQSIELVLTAFLAGLAVGENMPPNTKYFDN